MIKRNLKTAILFTFTSALIFTSCTSQNETKEETPVIETELVNELAEAKLELLILNLPLPIEIITSVNKAGMPYNPFLSKTYTEKLVSQHEKAMRLGMFGADMMYHLKNDYAQSALTLLQESQNLADNLNVQFDDAMLQKYSENENEQDSLLILTLSLYEHLEKTLKNNNQIQIATLIITGSWLEGFYIGTSSFFSKQGNSNVEVLRKDIGTYQYQMSSLVSLLQEFKDEPYFAKQLTDLEKIETFFATRKDKENLSNKEIESLKQILTGLRINK